MRKVRFVIIPICAFVFSTVLGLCNFAECAAVKCPAGTVRGGENLDSIAQCNVPADKNDDKKVMKTINKILNVVVGFVGVVSVFVVVLGGIHFSTSQGDTAKVAKAKNTILYGVVGLIISLLAYVIVKFVLDNMIA